MLCINPPFEHFALVIRKIAVDSARAIVITHEWTHLRWHKPLQGITLSSVLIPKVKTLFPNDEGKVFRQRKWRTHGYLVDGSLDLENFQDNGVPSISEIPYFEVDATNSDGLGGVATTRPNTPSFGRLLVTFGPPTEPSTWSSKPRRPPKN